MAYPIEEIKYLSLEGGGGRGILFSEPVKVLEDATQDLVKEKYNSNLGAINAFRQRVQYQIPELDSEGGVDSPEASPPDFEVNLPAADVTDRFPLIQTTIPPQFRLIKGISGSSAGAITAFMLSLGMSSEDIKAELNRTDIKTQNSKYSEEISVFEQLIDEEPNNNYKRVVDKTIEMGEYPDRDGLDDFMKKAIWRALPMVIPAARFSRYALYKYLRKKFDDGAPFGVAAKLFESVPHLEEFLVNAISGRGLFTGQAGRKYFSELIEKYLYPTLEDENYPVPEKPAGELTFREFYDLTGVDLVVTGTNISRHSTRYFSVYHTPEFPVIEAVQISMTLPPVFRPVFLKSTVREGDDEQNTKYEGLYVDGGMLNNYPIHAFDHIEDTANPSQDAKHLRDLTYRGLKGEYPIAGNPKLRTAECDCVLGMRLQEKPKEVESYSESHYYPKDDSVFLDFIGNLLNTFMYGSEEGQIRTIGDEKRTVEFYATAERGITDGVNGLYRDIKNLSKEDNSYAIPVADFATAAINRARKQPSIATVKESLMNAAGKRMIDYLSKGKSK